MLGYVLHRLAIEARLCIDRSLSSECNDEEIAMIREAGIFTMLRQYDTALSYVCIMRVNGNYTDAVTGAFNLNNSFKPKLQYVDLLYNLLYSFQFVVQLLFTTFDSCWTCCGFLRGNKGIQKVD